jgi:hypothetical protein
MRQLWRGSRTISWILLLFRRSLKVSPYFPFLVTRFKEKRQRKEQRLRTDVNGPSEFIPVPNMTTDDPTQVYPRESVIPSREWQAIDIAPIVKAKDEKSRIALLPTRHSTWLINKMGEIIRGPSTARKDSLYVIHPLSSTWEWYDSLG